MKKCNIILASILLRSISNKVIDDQRLRKSDKAYLVNYILIMLKSFEDETE